MGCGLFQDGAARGIEGQLDRFPFAEVGPARRVRRGLPYGIEQGGAQGIGRAHDMPLRLISIGESGVDGVESTWLDGATDVDPLADGAKRIVMAQAAEQV